MERRIKILYIITIVAISAFLGMQVYWLKGRYEYAVQEYETVLVRRILSCVENYNLDRKKKVNWSRSTSNSRGEVFTFPSYRLWEEMVDSGKVHRKVGIYTFRVNLTAISGVDIAGRSQQELRQLALAVAAEDMRNAVDSLIFDASGAADENEAWGAARNVNLERSHPFDPRQLEAALKKEGVDAEVTVRKSGTMVWTGSEKRDVSLLHPSVTVSEPISQLEGKVVTVNCAISPLQVMPQLWMVLLVSLVVFILLVICLLWQLVTVRRLNRLDRMRDSFISTMIHELKRPVSTLKMCVSCLENDRMSADREMREEVLAETRGALDNLSAYFSKLRDITYNKSEQIPLNIQQIPLREFIDSIINATECSADKDVTLENIVDEGVEVTADRTHLHNILSNLVENAVKYSGKQVSITFAASENDNFTEIVVADSGNGIAERDLHHIFNRFYRGDAAYSGLPGMGLGLAYVKLLVEAHGGKVQVESSVGVGSRFIIRLPKSSQYSSQNS